MGSSSRSLETKEKVGGEDGLLVDPLATTVRSYWVRTLVGSYFRFVLRFPTSSRRYYVPFSHTLRI
jgi:hypothetical protein